jgi:autotransporter-associated beta strand protein
MKTPRDVRRSVRKLFAALCAAAFLQQSAAAQYVVQNTSGSSATSGSLPYELSLLPSSGGDVAWNSGGAGAISLTGTSTVQSGATLDATGSLTGVTLTSGGLSLNGTMTLVNTVATPFALGTTLQGNGSVTVAGSGNSVITLTGTNSYSGGTTLNSGILNVNTDAALGNTSGGLTFNGGTLQAGGALTSARTITLNANGTFDANGYASTLSGLIGGTGQLTVADGAGGGILSLTNTGNSYSGGTLLSGGTLAIQNDSVLGTGGLTFNGGALQTGVSLSDSRSILLESLGGIFDTAGTTSTLSGLMSGGGALTKISSGTLILSGANTYTGGTVIKGGVLQVSNESNLGGNSGAITLNGGILQTAGALSDSRNVYLGASGGTIDTDGNNDVFSGVFSDSTTAGSLAKIGSGILTLSAVNTYTGGTTVSAGTLQMGIANAMPTGGALTIGSGGTFSMNGFNQTNALGNVVNNGAFNMGAGQLNLAGTYQGSGTLSMTLQPGVTNITGGNMTLTGGTLSVALNDPGVRNNDTFTAISATSLNHTAFASINPLAAVTLIPTYNYVNNTLTFTATLNPFVESAATPNQAAVAGALESLRAQVQSDPTGSAATVITELYSLNAAQIQAAFDQIGPIAYVGMGALGLSGSKAEAEALSRRMTALDDGTNTGGVSLSMGDGKTVNLGALLAEGGTDETDPFGRRFQSEKDAIDTGFGFFGSAIGTSGHLQSLNGSAGFQPGFDYNSGGVVLGGDYRVSDALALGLLGGYTYGHANVYTDAGSAIGDDSGRAGVYAAFHEGGFRADLYAGGGLDSFSTNRGILIGSASQNAVAKPSGRELNANGYFTYDVPTKNYGTLAPYLGIDEDRLMIRSFSESGAGALDLNVGAQTAQSLRSSLGLRQSTRSSSEGTTIDAHWSLGWVHEFSDQSRPIDAQLASGGSAFSVQTAKIAADGALAGAGIVVSVAKDTSVNVDYSADIRNRFTENTLQAALHLLF